MKQVFVLLLSFIRTLATKCISSNNQLCLTRPAYIDLNPNELHCHLFWLVYIDAMEVLIFLMIHLVEYVFWIKQKKVYSKVFTIITRKNGLTKHTSCHYKCIFNGTKCNLHNDICLCDCKKNNKTLCIWRRLLLRILV